METTTSTTPPKVTRQLLIDLIFHGHDPFDDCQEAMGDAFELPVKAMGFDQPLEPLQKAYAMAGRPKFVVEAGTWRGWSAYQFCQMGAEIMLCIDTWLGGSDPYMVKNFPWNRNCGLPDFYGIFMNNMRWHKLTDRVVPFPNSSIAAAMLLNHWGIQAPLIYIDGGHSKFECLYDLRYYWPLLEPEGVMLVDDYDPNKAFVGVVQAVQQFSEERGLEFEICHDKAIFRKPHTYPEGMKFGRGLAEGGHHGDLMGVRPLTEEG